MAPRAAARLESLGFDRVYEYKAGKQDWLAAGLPSEGRPATEPTLASVVRRNVPRFGLEDRVGLIRAGLAAGGWEWAAVVNPEGILLGRVRGDHVAEPEATAASVMDEGPATYRPNVPLEELLEQMDKGSFDMAFVTDPDGRLLGLVRRRDMVEALGRRR